MFVRNRREGVSGHLSEKLALERLAKRITKESNTDNESNVRNSECDLEYATDDRHGDEYISDDEQHCTVALTFTIQPHSRSDYYLPQLKSNNNECHTLTFHSSKESEHFWEDYKNKLNDSCIAVDDKNNLTMSLETSRITEECKEIDALRCEQMSAEFSFQFELLRHYFFRHFVNCKLLQTLSSTRERQMEHFEKQFMKNNSANMEIVPKFTRSELEELPARWVLQSINEMERVSSTRRFVTPLDVNELVYVRHAECLNTQATENTDCTVSRSDLNSKCSVDHNRQNVNTTPSTKTTLKQPNTSLCNQNVADVGVANSNSSSNNSDSSNMTNDQTISNPVYRVTDTAFMSNGEYWVEVEQLDQTNNICNNHHETNTNITNMQERESKCAHINNNNNKKEEGITTESDGNCHRTFTRLRVQREMVELCQPKELYIDPFVPCDEAFAIQGTSTCIYVSLLKALLRNEHANLQNTLQEQESISSYKVMECTDTCRGTKHCETNVDNKKSNIIELQSAIEQNQEKVEKHIPRKSVSYMYVLAAAKRKAASVAVCVALQTHNLRKTLATEYAELQTKMELCTDTNALCKDDIPLVNVRWNAKNATVSFRLAVSEHVCHRLQQLQCMELMENDFIMQEQLQGMNEEKEEKNCQEWDLQQKEEQTNKCESRKFYEFTLRESVIMRLAYAFDFYMSGRNNIKFKNIEEGAPVANVVAADHILTNPTDTSELANTKKEYGSDDDINKCNCRNESTESHENTLNVKENNDCSGEQIEYKCKTVKDANVMNVHDFCKLLHARSLEENIIVNSIDINTIGKQEVKESKNNCTDADSHQTKITSEKYTEEMMQSTQNKNCNTSHAMFDLFALRVSTMCLRYRTLFGERGYNQGPHAALPQYVMNCLRHEFSITTEGFASPLNASLERYTSLFPDTDVYFGSCGGFCDVNFTSGHVEVNPPFDTAIMRKMEKHIFYCLRQSEEMSCSTEQPPSQATSNDNSLLFVIVLPSHTNLLEKESHNRKRSRSGLHGEKYNNNNNSNTCHRPNKNYSSKCSYTNSSNDNSNSGKTSREESCLSKSSTEYNLINSPFCLGHILCNAEDSCYVDGHQHVLHEALFCITTPTRLIVLGNKAAQRLYNSTHYFNNNYDDMLQSTHCNTSNNHSSDISAIHKGNEIQRRLTKIQKEWTEFTAAAKLSPHNISE